MGQGSDVLDIVHGLYAAALGEEDWSTPLCAIADYCGAENAALVRVDHAVGFSSVVAPRADPEVIAAYNLRWWAEDPTVAATSGAPVGKITSLADTGRRQFRNSMFHNEFWSHSGLGAERLAVNLALTEAGFASCVVQASATRDELHCRAERRFSLITPHLIRAVAIQSRLHRQALENAALSVPKNRTQVGLVAVDAALRVLFADQPAEALLAKGIGLQLRDGKFRLADQRVQDRLQHAVFACANIYRDLAAVGPIPWSRDDGSRPFLIEVSPWSPAVDFLDMAGPQPAAILLIHDPRKNAGTPLTRKDGSPRQEKASPPIQSREELFGHIIRDIAANLGESDVSLSWLAERHGVTPRRIRDLFYAENTNFTDYLLNARLDRAREMLTDPALLHVNIASIALDCGFGDISWFHHTFRRRFKMTPVDMRKGGHSAS